MSRSIKDNTTNPIKTLLNNACLLGLHKNKKFLEKLFDKRILTIDGASDTRAIYAKVKLDFFKILDLFEEKYKGQADLGFYQYSDKQFTPYFKVLYPKFTITNSHGRTHEIRDLFVYHSFKFTNGSLHPYKLEGGRLSKTDLEILSNYQQSHLGSHSWLGNPLYCSHFCVGGDTDVSRMLAEFEVEMDLDRYELFLFCVDTMITWESLEGVPYIRMEVIENASSSMVTHSNPSYELTVVNTIMNDKTPLDMDFYVSDGIYKIRPNLRASDFIKKIVLKCYNFTTAKTILVSRVPNSYNKFQQMKIEGDMMQKVNKITANTDYTIFRGKKVYPKIIREDSRRQVSTSIEDYIVYPKFLENVIRKLESRIYEKAVVKNATKLYHTSSNAPGGVTSDTVSV